MQHEGGRPPSRKQAVESGLATGRRSLLFYWIWSSLSRSGDGMNLWLGH